MALIQSFISEVSAIYKTGKATEHSYRAAFKALFEGLDTAITAINEPKREACGAPDFILQRGDFVIGHVEAKDIHIGLRGMKDANKHQQDRYRKALPNLIYTNCLDWDFYRNGELVASVTIADYLMGIQPRTEEYPRLENLLREFLAQRPQPITSPRELAERMAGKAALIKDVLHKILLNDRDETSQLSGEYRAFREQLIHDISLEEFADLYAETIAYGLFAARLHDTTPKDFSRQEALELLPKSNPFLRSFFSYIAGPDLDDGVKWIIDDLAAVFQYVDMHQIMAGFGKFTGQRDPFLHFYETFLAAYNPAKRKARGVWYTPEAVVNFIVRAVDEVLQTEFGLADGLADTSQVTVDWDTGQTNAKGKAITLKKTVHRVQVLDPATGTGTFLAEVIKRIAPKIKNVAPGQWSGYIEQHLIPRLHGFELLMASYAMCHLKLDMILTELGYQPTGTPPRLSVYLTNSLEQGEREVRDLFMAQWLTREARAANDIKRQTPIMCVLGNPPYLGEGGKSEGWLGDLMDDYKKEPGGKQRLNESNPKWLNDLYVKFLRLASHLVEKNGEGVVGFITNHGYLDNPTFRGMRWHLLNNFDKLYVLDLHGNSKKKETAPDGSADKNVFDIQQGVAILIAVKKQAAKTDKKALAQVYHHQLWGNRESKYQTLFAAGLTGRDWQALHPTAPMYFFTPRDTTLEAAYQAGFGVQELMPVNSVGIVTARDELTIDMDKATLWQRVQDFVQLEPETARAQYALGQDVQDWSVARAQADAREGLSEGRLVPISYRPFDTRWTYYTGTSRGFQCRTRFEVMRHMLAGENIGLATARSNKNPTVDHFFISSNIMETKCAESSTQSGLFPLYLYPTEQDLDQSRRVNFDPKLYAKLQKLATHPQHGVSNEVQVFDYIYGVLHCPAYRAAYAEFLKSDFPHIPWPASPEQFWEIAEKGGLLRRLHLMEPAAIGDTPYPFIGEGETKVEKPEYRNGQIWINANHFFDAVDESVWDFHIGGYQPAQKWLKDRKGRVLCFDEVRHYQRILKILSETGRIMATMTMPL